MDGKVRVAGTLSVAQPLRHRWKTCEMLLDVGVEWSVAYWTLDLLSWTKLLIVEVAGHCVCIWDVVCTRW